MPVGTRYTCCILLFSVCQPVEMDSDGAGSRMMRISYIYYLTKFTQLLDTIFFVGRKKFSQISVLNVRERAVIAEAMIFLEYLMPRHNNLLLVYGIKLKYYFQTKICPKTWQLKKWLFQVFHHGIVPLYAFSVARWTPGGSVSFLGLINSGIHVIMYFYYFVASFGPRFQKHLWWGRYLTLLQVYSPHSCTEELNLSLEISLQMLQLAAIIVHSSVNIFGLVNCGFPWQMSLITASMVTLIQCLFANFYIQKYKRGPNLHNNQNGIILKKGQWWSLLCRWQPRTKKIYVQLQI